jgi:hypothetical protein
MLHNDKRCDLYESSSDAACTPEPLQQDSEVHYRASNSDEGDKKCLRTFVAEVFCNSEEVGG